MKKPRPRIVRRNAPAVATQGPAGAAVATPSAAAQGAATPSPPVRQRRARGNGSAGHPILPPGIGPTLKKMAAMAGEFPTMTPGAHGATTIGYAPSIARQPAAGGGKPSMGEVAYADPYRLFPREQGDAYVYNPGVLVTRKGYSVIDEMRRDEQVKAALTFKKQAVIAAGWKVDPPEGKEEDEVTDFVRQVLQEIDGSFERTLLEILTALDFGFSIAERVWEQREDGRLGLRALKVRRPHTFEFRQDAYGNVTGLRQQNRELPIDKFVVYSYDYEFSNPYGRTDLEACYRAWWTKRNAYMWMAMLLERLGIPPIFLLYNPNDYNNTDRAQLQRILQNLQAGTVGLFPRPNEDSAEFFTPELAGQVSQVFVPAMDKFDKDISRGLLMPGLMGMTADDKQGSLARSRVHFDVFMLVLERIRAEVQERVMQEQVIRPLVELNFGAMPDEEMPQFKFLPITDEKTAELVDKWIQLVGGKVVLPTDEDEKFLRQAMEFPEFDPDAAAERVERANEQVIEAEKAKMDAGLSPIGAIGQAPKGAPPGKPKPEEESDEEEETKKAALTDEQFERVLEELREAAEVSE